MQDRILNLTVALYRVTDYFPKAEILRSHLRVKANEIFERSTEYQGSSELDHEIQLLVQKIRTMKGYLAIASTLNYVRAVNFTVLEKEYDYIERALEAEQAKLLKHSIPEDIRRLEQAHALPPAIADSISLRGVTSQEHAEKKDQPKPMAPMAKSSETEEAPRVLYEKKDEGLNERQRIIMDYLKKSGPAKISDFYASFRDISSKTIQRDLQALVDMQVLKKEGEKRWTVYSL